MRLTTIRASDLFSFDDLSLTLGPHLTVVVGPNGAGKTNVIRALQLARLAAEYASGQSQAALQRLAAFSAARRDAAAPGDRTSVTIGIELDAADERRLVGGFVRAAVVSSLAREAPGHNPIPEVLQWIDRHVTDDALAPMFTGELNVKVPRDGGDRWEVAYRFAVDQAAYAVDLTGGLGGIRVDRDERRDGFQQTTIGSRLDLRMDSVDQARPFTLARVLPEFGHQTGLSVEPITVQPIPDAVRQFLASVGADINSGPPRIYGLASVLDLVLRHGVAILSETRLPPRTTFPAREEPRDDDRSWLPLRLFELKNGDAEARQRFEAVRALYADLIGGPTFDLTAAHIPQSAEQAADSTLQISLVVPGHGRDIPIEFAGMGAWEALALSAVLAGRQYRVLALDEPAVNLHPAAQRRLLTRLLQAETEQSIVVTHSPYLVPAGNRTQLAQIIRIDRSSGASRVHCLGRDGADGRSTWVKELADSADARSLLFAAGVILLEGDTELGALSVWFGRCATAGRCGSAEQLNVSLLNVGGDRNFRTFIEICRRFGIPWAVVCDGAALDAKRPKSEQILRQVAAAGGGDDDLSSWLEGRAAATFEEAREVAQGWGIFTLATGPEQGQESFESFLDRVAAPEALVQCRRTEPDSKPRQGRCFAEKIECPPEIDALYASLLSHLGLAAAPSSMSASPG